MIKEGNDISGMQLAVRQDVDTSLYILMFNNGFQTSRRVCGCLISSYFAITKKLKPLRKFVCKM